MKTHLLTVAVLMVIISCKDDIIPEDSLDTDQLNSVDAIVETPTRTGLEIFMPDSTPVSRQIRTFKNGLPSADTITSFRVDPNGLDNIYLYSFEDNLLTEELYYSPYRDEPFKRNFIYDAEFKLTQIDYFDAPGSLNASRIFDHRVNEIFTTEWVSKKIVLEEGDDFRIDHILTWRDTTFYQHSFYKLEESKQSNARQKKSGNDTTTFQFNYANGLVNSIEEIDSENNLLQIVEFEYLNKEVLGAYISSKFFFESNWKINSILDDTYSAYLIEEGYITKHTITEVESGKISEYLLWYEFDSLDRITDRYHTYLVENVIKEMGHTYYEY